MYVAWVSNCPKFKFQYVPSTVYATGATHTIVFNVGPNFTSVITCRSWTAMTIR